MKSERKYNFGGHAVGFAADLHHFGTEPMEVDTSFEGSAALPATGGALHSESPARQVIHPQHGFLLSFQSSSASVRGHSPKETHRPTVDMKTKVTGLVVGTKGLEIDQLSSHLVAEDPRRIGDKRDRGQVIHSFPEDPIIDGVRIAGKTLHIELDRRLLEFPTLADLIREFKCSRKFQKEYKDRISFLGGYAATTIVKRITFGNDQTDRELIHGPNRVRLESLGKIIFGELYFGVSKRRLTLLRLELGSDMQGRSSGGDSKCSLPDPNPTPEH